MPISTACWKSRCPARYGCRASSLTCPITGAITNRDRNRASPAITWFGGIDCKPSAFRVIARTTKIFVNDVIMSSRAGATLSSVIPMRVTTADDGVPSGPFTSR